MSAFTDFATQGFDEALDVIGRTEVTISGHTYDAILDQFTSAKELDVGGFVGEFDAVVMMAAADLSGDFAAPIDKTVVGLTLSVASRTYRIEKATMDELTLTLALINPHK